MQIIQVLKISRIKQINVKIIEEKNQTVHNLNKLMLL